MASLDDVARAAGVSKSVASRTLTGDQKARISDATREKVRAAADRLDYVPNARARGLRRSRSGAIGLIVPDASNSVFADLLAGVQDITAAAGTDVLLGQVDHPPVGTQQLSRLVREGRVDGILIQRSEEFDDAMLSQILGSTTPVITVNSRLPDRPGSVILDDAAGSATATRHLLDLGHRRIAMISGVNTHDTARRREDGFRAAMQLAARPVDPAMVIEAGWEADAGGRAMNHLLDSFDGMPAAERPTAVLVASVNAGVGAVSAALQRGVQVPGEMSVVAVNTTWVSETIHPAISTVRMPLRHVGRIAATRLLEHFDGGPLTDEVVTDPAPELLVRGTTAPPPSH